MEGTPLPTADEEAPACSGVLALRKITQLLSKARRADAQGDLAEARELYTELLKVQRSIARAPLGSIGKSLKDVASEVEARLKILQQNADVPTLEADSITCSGSRPPTHGSAPSGLPKGRGGSKEPRLSHCADRTHSGDVVSSMLQQQSIHAAWGTMAFDAAPSSASGRPQTRGSADDGGNGRPGTRDGGTGRPGPRGQTADRSSLTTRESASGLDGMRPSTRDGARLQQVIEGKTSKTSKREPNRGSGEIFRDRSDLQQRPTTRDGVRLPSRGGPTGSVDRIDRRGQDIVIRQVNGKKKAHQKQKCAEVMSLEDVASHDGSHDGKSPRRTPEISPEESSSDAESDLLE